VQFVKAAPSMFGICWPTRKFTLIQLRKPKPRELTPHFAFHRDVDAEHKAILDACLARDSDLACKRIDEHLTRTTNILLRSPLLKAAPLDLRSSAGE